MKSFFGFFISFIIHICFFIFLIYENTIYLDTGGMDAKLGDFKSIFVVSNLPIDSLKEYSIDQTKSLKSDEAKEEKIITKLQEQPSNIQVKKKNHIKNKKKSPQKADINSNINSQVKNESSSIPEKSHENEVLSPVTGMGLNMAKSYKGLVLAHLNKYKKYPHSALINNLESKVKATVVVDSEGNILDVKIKNKVDDILKNACITLFKNSKKLPKPPKEFLNSKNELAFNITIDYNIKKSQNTRNKF